MQDLDAVLLLLLGDIILRLPVLPGGEVGAPRRVRRPNRPPVNVKLVPSENVYVPSVVL